MVDMAKQWSPCTSKEVSAISQRLYSTSQHCSKHSANIEEETTKASKETIDSSIERLHLKDPYAKREELVEKAHHDSKNDRGKYYDHQDKVECVGRVTKRLFNADYVNRNVHKEVVTVKDEKKLTRKDLDASTNRLFIKDYTKRNEVLHQRFYRDALSKKKSDEKVLKSEEQVEASKRLSTVKRDPAECNKELRGKRNFNDKGIYGTYAVTDPCVYKAIS